MKNWLSELIASESEPEIERRLRQESPGNKPPVDLHEAIMARIQTQATSVDSIRPMHQRVWRSRWLPIPALAFGVIALLLLIQANHSSTPKDPGSNQPFPSTPASTLEFGQSVASSLVIAVSPLADELKSIQADLDRTEGFLVANLP